MLVLSTTMSATTVEVVFQRNTSTQYCTLLVNCTPVQHHTTTGAVVRLLQTRIEWGSTRVHVLLLYLKHWTTIVLLQETSLEHIHTLQLGFANESPTTSGQVGYSALTMQNHQNAAVASHQGWFVGAPMTRLLAYMTVLSYGIVESNGWHEKLSVGTSSCLRGQSQRSFC